MIRQGFRSWVADLDKEKYDALSDRKTWIFILTTFGIIIAALSYTPVLVDLFNLQVKPVLLCLIPVVICALLTAPAIRRNMSIEQSGMMALATSFSFQLFMWSLVCFSDFPGAMMLASLPILLAAHHGDFFQVSYRYPWGALTTIGAVVGALFMSSGAEHLALVGVGGLVALGALITTGNHARLQQQAVRERNAMREAIDAQTLLEQVRETEQTQDLMVEIRGANHDAGNALSGILMNLDMIQEIVNAETISDEDIQEIREMSVDLADGSKRLRQLIEKGRQVGKEAADRESVDIMEVVRAAVDDVRVRYPNATQTVFIDDELPSSYYLKLHGGALALNRVLLNLMINAHEGNGKSSSSEICIHIGEDAEHLQIQVKDNGPGFSEEQLKQPLSNIKTTKDNGTGLGLYTSLRLINANRGALSYNNNAEGGACVTINFPRQVA